MFPRAYLVFDICLRNPNDDEAVHAMRFAGILPLLDLQSLLFLVVVVVVPGNREASQIRGEQFRS